MLKAYGVHGKEHYAIRIPHGHPYLFEDRDVQKGLRRAKKMATVETVALLIEWTVYMRKTE
jgi:hypothetical protein